MMPRRQRNGSQSSEPTVRKHRPDYQIPLFMSLLMLLGLVVMYAIGPQRAHVLNMSFGTDNYSDTYFFIKQALSLALALATFVVMSRIPYSFFQKHAKRLIVIGLIACIILAIAGALKLGIAQCSLGACRWFDLGPLGSLQPAEFLKFAILIFIAGLIGTRYREGKINDHAMTLMPIGVILLVAAFFVIGLQKDMGTGLSLIAIVSAMLFAAGLHHKTFAIMGAVLIGLLIVFIIIAPHRVQRITAFMAGDNASVDDPEAYHIAHAKIAIGSGGLLGVGIGNSVQATGYLPEAINDSVFAIMGETFGFVGLIVILALFTGLLLRLLRVADHLPNMTMRMIAIGVFGWLGAHVVLNVAAMTGIFPLTGITLPLLSFGGTSMVFIAGALGLIFQLSQYTTNDTSVEGGADENSRSRRGLGRTRHAYSGRS